MTLDAKPFFADDVLHINELTSNYDLLRASFNQWSVCRGRRANGIRVFIVEFLSRRWGWRVIDGVRRRFLWGCLKFRWGRSAALSRGVSALPWEVVCTIFFAHVDLAIIVIASCPIERGMLWVCGWSVLSKPACQNRWRGLGKGNVGVRSF